MTHNWRTTNVPGDFGLWTEDYSSMLQKRKKPVFRVELTESVFSCVCVCVCVQGQLEKQGTGNGNGKKEQEIEQETNQLTTNL